jgi:hypothetical protein
VYADLDPSVAAEQIEYPAHTTRRSTHTASTATNSPRPKIDVIRKGPWAYAEVMHKVKLISAMYLHSVLARQIDTQEESKCVHNEKAPANVLEEYTLFEHLQHCSYPFTYQFIS